MNSPLWFSASSQWPLYTNYMKQNCIFSIQTKLRPLESSITHVRPRFKIVCKHSQEEVKARFKALIESKRGLVKAKMIQDHIILDIIDKDSHYWSPQMNFRVEEDEFNPGTTIIAGIIGPTPQVWTLFVFIYASLAIIGFFISSHGVSQWMLDKYSHSIWAFPIAIVLMLTAYLAGREGESLGAEQVEFLKDLVREALKGMDAELVQRR